MELRYVNKMLAEAKWLPIFLSKLVVALAVFVLTGSYSQSVSAEVWADIRDNVIINNGVVNCTECHSISKTDITANSSSVLSRHSAPLGVDFDGITDLDAYNSITSILEFPGAANGDTTWVDNIEDRIYERAANNVTIGYMPMDPVNGTDFTDHTDLSAARMLALQTWAIQGAPYATAGAMTSSANSISKTGATLNAGVNVNVHVGSAVPGTAYFEYGLTTSYGTQTTAITNLTGTSGAARSTAISGLTCGTLYNFRVAATNGSGTTNGSNQTFTTSACTNPVISGGVTSVSPPATNEEVAATFSLTRTDNDPGTLTWSASTQGSKGTFSFDTSTTSSPVTVRYTPMLNQTGSDTAGRIRVTNSTTGLTDTITINMSITVVNDAPAITSSAVTTATEDVQYSYFVTESDPDDGGYGAGLTISLSNAPAGMVVNPTTGEITWTPTNGIITSGLVTVTVADGGENSAAAATQMFTVNVTPVNDPPVITSTAGTTATEDIAYSYQVLLTDVDDSNNGINISFSLSGAPAGMGVSNTGLITWTPLEGVTTSGTVTVTVEDGNEDGSTPTIGNNGQEAFTIAVTQVNDSPTITSTASTSATEGVLYSYTVTEGDPDDNGFGAGNGLTVALSNAPFGMALNANTGEITWTPGNGVLSSGLVTITVTDGGEDGSIAATQQFTISVNATNDPPFITSSAVTTATEDIPYSYLVLVNDIDDSNNGADITFVLNNEPVGMSVSATGLITWVPFEGVTTSGAVTVTVEDGNEDGSTPTTGNNGVQNFTVSVTTVNDAPIIISTAITIATEDVPYSYFVTENDPDDGPYNTGLTISLTNQPTGMVVSPTTGEITWTPVNGVTTSGLVTVTVTDGGEDAALPAIQQFAITVTPVNDAPSITSSAITAATEDVQYSYLVTESDPDDGGYGAGLTISLTNAPTGMVVNPTTGEITWTPANGVSTSGLVTVTVADGGENGAPAATQMFTVAVIAVNDSASITSSAITSADENTLYSYAVTASDVDDTGGFGSGINQLQISLSGAPSGMVVAPTTGIISWTPPRTGAQLVYNNITVTVQDGLEDGAVVSQQLFSITVNIDDVDSDLVAVYADNCPSLANAGQEDNDNDTVYVANSGFPVIGDVDPSNPLTGGDVCDTDDDNDGMPDAFEITFAFLDPFDSADAAADEDGDGLTNLEEYNIDNTGNTIATDSVGPDVTAPGDVTIDASGLLTTVDLGAATAIDGNDGELTLFKVALNATVADCNALTNLDSNIESLRPGKHTVTWVTCDSAKNLGSDTQIVNVKPLVSLLSGQTVGEGQAVRIDVVLNGDATAYPATIDYTLTGTAVASMDHDGIAGTVSIATKGEVGTISFNTLSDGVVEGDETVIVTLNSPFNVALSNATQHTVTITEANVTPKVILEVTQAAAMRGNVVYQPDGNAFVLAKANDGNGDTLSYDWSASDATLLGVSSITGVGGNQLDINPATLTLDAFYTVSVTVTDGVSPITIERLLQVKGVPVVLMPVDSDGDGTNDDNPTEGFADDDADGIPNYLDNISTPANAIENHTVNLQTSVLIETNPGLHIAMGETAVAAETTGVLIGLQDIVDHGGRGGSAVSNAVTDYTFLSALLNFEVSGLSENIVSVNVVIPLQSAIQAEAVVRKYNSTGWFDFVVDDFNEIRSASGIGGVCPQPGSDLYTTGLTVGDLCLQLTIQDGGANDADGVRNYIVKDPGGLALAPEPDEDITAVESSGSSSGRIGSTSYWFMLAFLMCATYLLHRRKLKCLSKL